MDLPQHKRTGAITNVRFSTFADRQRFLLALDAHADEVPATTERSRDEGDDGAGFADLELAARSPFESDNLGLGRFFGEYNSLTRTIERRIAKSLAAENLEIRLPRLRMDFPEEDATYFAWPAQMHELTNAEAGCHSIDANADQLPAPGVRRTNHGKQYPAPKQIE